MKQIHHSVTTHYTVSALSNLLAHIGGMRGLCCCQALIRLWRDGDLGHNKLNLSAGKTLGA